MNAPESESGAARNAEPGLTFWMNANLRSAVLPIATSLSNSPCEKLEKLSVQKLFMYVFGISPPQYVWLGSCASSSGSQPVPYVANEYASSAPFP